jgi:FdrA protein
MAVSLRILSSTYYDSVFLMGIAGRLMKAHGVKRAAALMATPKNKALLEEFGVPSSELAQAEATDLALAVDTVAAQDGDEALALVDGWLNEEVAQPSAGSAESLDGALQRLPEASLAVISVPGEYAAYEARRALERGLHVFVFSDNVALEDEIALKREAAERGLLLMGPDCGTAIIAGAGIGFANAVRRGPIGVVGPSGTGIQQVTSLIHTYGSGVSHAIGAGSRDLSDAVGGLTTLAALQALAEDDETRVIVVVAKPPGAATRQRVLDWIAGATKPVVTCFLGDGLVDSDGSDAAPLTLDEAARRAVALAGTPPAVDESDHAAGVAPVGGCVRGLFAGGTFCYEAQQIFLTAGVPVRSNAPLRKDLLLADPWHGDGHCMVDLGDDAFTQGRPHPMIDATLRNERIVAEAADSSVGVLLLDFILGYGAAADPVGDTLPALRDAFAQAAAAGRGLRVVASVCGTDDDPQGRARQVAMLEEIGVVVLPSNAAAAQMALRLVQTPTAVATEVQR